MICVGQERNDLG